MTSIKALAHGLQEDMSKRAHNILKVNILTLDPSVHCLGVMDSSHQLRNATNQKQSLLWGSGLRRHLAVWSSVDLSFHLGNKLLLTRKDKRRMPLRSRTFWMRSLSPMVPNLWFMWVSMIHRKLDCPHPNVLTDLIRDNLLVQRARENLGLLGCINGNEDPLRESYIDVLLFSCEVDLFRLFLCPSWWAMHHHTLC